MNSIVAPNVEKIITRKCLKQSAVAKKAGYSKQQFNDMLRGRKVIILKDWVEAQMALLDIEMVRFEEIFLPYIETSNGQTIFQKLEEHQFLLETGEGI